MTADTHRVRVEPLGVDLDVAPGETIFGAAHRLGYAWPTVCGGVASCRVCYLEVVEGADCLSEMSELERRALAETFGGNEHDGKPVRLTCQTELIADGAVVYKRGVARV
jgi:ferredoxin, 2Fe-2S